MLVPFHPKMNKGGIELKVAFWSNARGKSCVTSNLACISVLSTLRCPGRRTIVFENHQNIINLGSTWFSPRSSDYVVNENTEYTIDTGLGKILQLVEKGEKPAEEDFFRYARDFLGKQLFYLPTESIRNADVLEYRISRDCERTLHFLEQYGELVLVDTSAAPLDSSRRILQEADLVVVNLSQNRQMMSHFFRNYSDIRKKAFYLIGNYDAQSELNKHYIMKKYNIKGSRIGIIPHNTRFADAVSDGKLIPFLLKNYQSRPGDEEYSFIAAVKETEQLFQNQLYESKSRG